MQWLWAINWVNPDETWSMQCEFESTSLTASFCETFEAGCSYNENSRLRMKQVGLAGRHWLFQFRLVEFHFGRTMDDFAWSANVYSDHEGVVWTLSSALPWSPSDKNSIELLLQPTGSELLRNQPSSKLGANQYRFPATPTTRRSFCQYPATYLHRWSTEDVRQILLKLSLTLILGRHVRSETHIKLPTVRLVNKSSIRRLLMLPTTWPGQRT